MGFIYVADGIDDVLAAHLDQYADAWSGVAGKGVPFNVVAVNDPINFAISARNLDPTNSRAAQFLKADGTVLFQCDASGVKVSPDGNVASVPVTAAATQTLTNKTLTSPHMTGPVVDSGGLTVTLGGITVTGASTFNTAISLPVGAGAVSGAGVLKLQNLQAIGWRNGANTADDAMFFDGSDRLALQNILTVTTIGAAGGAAALPATPLGYLRLAIGASGTTIVSVPYYTP